MTKLSFVLRVQSIEELDDVKYDVLFNALYEAIADVLTKHTTSGEATLAAAAHALVDPVIAELDANAGPQ